jgi:hypothetical protein
MQSFPCSMHVCLCACPAIRQLLTSRMAEQQLRPQLLENWTLIDAGSSSETQFETDRTPTRPHVVSGHIMISRSGPVCPPGESRPPPEKVQTCISYHKDYCFRTILLNRSLSRPWIPIPSNRRRGTEGGIVRRTTRRMKSMNERQTNLTSIRMRKAITATWNPLPSLLHYSALMLEWMLHCPGRR